MRKPIAVLLAVLLAWLAVGCHADDNRDQEREFLSLEEERSSEETEILTYAVLTPEHANREAIESFNRTHADVQIVVKEYSDAESRKRLLTEILAGQIPDIIDLYAGEGWNSFQLPYQRLAQKGYLEDLWPFIENDPSLGRDRLLEAPLRAAEVDGGLYMIFGAVSISTLAGDVNVVGNRRSWSLAELQNAYSAMPEGSTVLEYVCRKSDVLSYILPMSLDSFIDWNTGQCSFDSKDFRSIMEFVNSFPLEVDWSSNESVNAEISYRRQNGLQMLSSEIIDSVGRIAFINAQYRGNASFVGYPTEDGRAGSCFIIAGVRTAISSGCQNKDAAWEFVRQPLLPRYSEEMLRSQRTLTCIPINRIQYNMANKVDIEREPYEAMLFIGGPVAEIEPATPEDVLQFDDLVNSINKIDLCDSAVYNIVEDAAGPYFAGDKTLDETVELIQRRAQLYVNENR